MGFFDKIKAGLKKTRESVSDGFNGIFAAFRKVDEEFLDQLLETLIMADVDYETSETIIAQLRERAKREKIERADVLKDVLAEILADLMTGDNALHLETSPSVILVVGVNGVGKTTTIGKLAALLRREGKNVLVAAADTFRAAAIEQLEIWSKRADVEIVKHQENSDPASVIYDALQAAKARGTDVVICDTAGRLHNKQNLMAELDKMMRVIDRELPDANKEILLVVDGTTGQNAVIQAKYFKEIVPLTGIVLTKLDGTAKGGSTVSVKQVVGAPVKLVCVGEQIDDLQMFEPRAFADALLATEDDK